MIIIRNGSWILGRLTNDDREVDRNALEKTGELVSETCAKIFTTLICQTSIRPRQLAESRRLRTIAWTAQQASVQTLSDPPPLAPAGRWALPATAPDLPSIGRFA